MAEWWQSPRYEERRAAGEVVTPGLVDWGGLVNAFNAPYNERTGRLPDGPPPIAGNGTVTQYYNAGPGGAVGPKTDRYDPAMADPLELYKFADYTAKPHFVAPSMPASPKVFIPNQYPGPDPVPKTQDRLEAMPVGLPLNVPDAAKAGTRLSAPWSPDNRIMQALRGFSLADGIQGPSSPDDFGPDLSTLGLDDRRAQAMADSRRGPIRVNGTVYYPSGTSQPGAKRQPAPSQSPKRGFSLLDMLFGASGGGQQSGGGGGGFSLANAFTSANGGTPPAPTYTTTPFQEDRFQTTTGAQMPSSMNNSRWTTGY